MNAILELLHNAQAIETILGYTFKNKQLLALPFVHRSFVNENRDINVHNERLEFLGDSVLGLITAEHLYKELPNNPEGDLSYLRSRLVEASSCVSFVQKLGLDEYLLLGKGERLNKGRGRDSILSDFFEALVGAIYLDGGLEAAKEFFFTHFAKEIDTIIKTPLRNWKAILQDYCQKVHQTTPIYRVLEESGPDHSKMFKIAVYIDQESIGHGEGSSKKEAQQAAAANAMMHIDKL